MPFSFSWLCAAPGHHEVKVCAVSEETAGHGGIELTHQDAVPQVGMDSLMGFGLRAVRERVMGRDTALLDFNYDTWNPIAAISHIIYQQISLIQFYPWWLIVVTVGPNLMGVG